MTARKGTKKSNHQSLAPALNPVARAEETQNGLFPVVGIGASAGGLAAFEAFFSSMPADPGMAFVLVQHLAPNYTSILSDLIRRYTRLQVFEAEDGMTVQPNCTYVIPPNRDMELLNGALRLQELSEPRGHRLPIDYLFRSLAQDQRERAIGVVLSGTGSDGTLGVRAIKGEGGMVMAQNPESSEFDGMPRSAVATGLVDYALPPAEMPARLIAYVAYAFGKLGQPGVGPSPKAESSVKRIFSLLRAQTGHDFREYKPNTIHRQIARRMAVHQIEKMDDYIEFLQRTPAEVEALFLNFLIGVTSFFRDPEAYRAIEEQIIPKIFAEKSAMDGLIRVWSAGCSTGEEAYSIAILLQERMEALKQNHTIQIFATDIDNRTIATARAGYYPTMQAVLDLRSALEEELSLALERKQLRLFYQPQVNAAGRVIGVEALLRWQHPQRGLVLPNEFIPLAEDTGSILSIGLWVLETACAQLKAWENDAQTIEIGSECQRSAIQAA
jgi:two-component system CheB/CheR fusion protein